MRKRAYAASRSMTWAQTAKRYLATFETARERARPGAAMLPIDPIVSWNEGRAVPELRIEHFLSLCDSTGMLQHAVHSVPDRAHGYCVDDNARALLFSIALARSGETRLSETLTTRFAAFIQHAWNPDTRRFRNFMSYDRRWLEEAGSEDSHGRTLWALGECARNDTDPSRRRWAAALFKTALPVVEDFSSPRAWAFSLLGLDAYCTVVAGDLFADRQRGRLADRLMSMLSAKTNQGLGLVRGHACIRQRASSAGANRHGIENEHTDLRRCWPAIATLAQVATNCAIGMLQAGRHRELWQTSTRAGSVRSTAGRGGSNDFRVPCCVAGRWRPGVAWRSDACVRLVSGRERPAHGAHRCGYGQLLGWASSGSTQ